MRRPVAVSEQDSMIGNDWRTSRPPTVPLVNGKQQFPWRRRHESSTSNPNSRKPQTNTYTHVPAEVLVSSSGASDCDSSDIVGQSVGKYFVDIEVRAYILG